MSTFTYKATVAITGTMPTHSTRLVRGTINADSPRTARDQLRARGLKIKDLAQVPGDLKTTCWQGVVNRRHEAKAVAFTGELATLLGAGIPLLQAIDAITKQHHNGFRRCLELLRDRIAAGASLADAMRQHPQVFDPLSVSMVEVGEKSGTLDQVLDQLARFKQRSHQLKGRIGTALIYPSIVLTAGIAVTIFLMTFVVPKLLESLDGADRPLPFATRVVKAASDMLTSYWWLLALLAITSAGGFVSAMRWPRARRAWHLLLLRLPLIGEMIRKQAIVRIAVTVATLTRSGVEFIQALRIARRSTSNLVLNEALATVEDAVRAGRDIAPALEATGAFPNTVVQIFAVGQESGRLDDMLDRLAGEYDLQVQNASQRLIALLEPAVILLLAGFIGLVVLAVILPYMEAGNVL